MRYILSYPLSGIRDQCLGHLSLLTTEYRLLNTTATEGAVL